jgi:hypothetical protein
MNSQSSRADVSGRSALSETFQANWVPISLIGVGIAWLLAENTGLAERAVHDKRVQAAGRRIGEIASDIGIGGQARAKGDGSRSPQLLGPSGGPAIPSGDTGRNDGWVHQAAGAARGAISSVRDAGSAVLDRASKVTDYVGDPGDLAKRAGDPWLIGVAGMVAGAVLAAMLPPTRIEQEYIGEARDGLWNKANEIGHEAAERVRELAETTTRSSTHPTSHV